MMQNPIQQCQIPEYSSNQDKSSEFENESTHFWQERS